MKLTIEELTWLHSLVNNKPKEWRIGQAYFNYLFQINPDLANKIRETQYDPFYADHTSNSEERISNFLKYISDVE
jgi:hypothetical protein